MLNRRDFMLAAAALPVLSAPSRAAEAGPPPIASLLDRFVDQVMLESPQLMTSVGLDVGVNSGARWRLDDRSPDALERSRALFAKLAADLATRDPESLPPAERINHQTGAYLAATTLRSFEFPFGDPGVVAIPYIISQLSGAYQSLPSFLATQHPIASREDAEAYLSRLSAFGRLLDQETGRSSADFKKGVCPPDFVLRTTIEQLGLMLAPAPEQSELATVLARRAAERKIEGDWQARAARIVARDVAPALGRQQQLLRDMVPRAGSEAGVWRLPGGDDYYRYAVRAWTTTDIAPGEIHRFGLELVAELSARADSILKGQGLRQGSVARRLSALRSDPANHYPNKDLGRAALIDDLNQRIEAIRPRLGDYFGRMPKAGVEVRRMAASIEPGAPGATYQAPSLDGSRPGTFQINLRDLGEWPRFDLPTLVYHEAIPGHHFQIARMAEATDVPMLRRLPIFSGYTEGWALYAEQLVHEMGVYDDDPLGELGYVASLLFRAARLVVDSGLHHMRWSRERAIAYMIDTLGDARTSVAREVERYCVQPGQASSYALGWRVWTKARSRAKQRFGTRFNLSDFHDRGLSIGSVPLDVLAQVMDEWGAGA